MTIEKQSADSIKLTFTKFDQKEENKLHLPDQLKEVTAMHVGSPIMRNPCSQSALAEILRDVKKQSGVFPHGERRFMFVTCDGVPYSLAFTCKERLTVCTQCGMTGIDIDDQGQHCRLSHHGVSVEFEKEFDWVLLIPGGGHQEMSMVRSTTQFTWPVYFEKLAEIFHFTTPNGKLSAYKCSNHHKSMTLKQGERPAIAKELLTVYYRHAVDNHYSEVSIDDFHSFAENDMKDFPNFRYMYNVLMHLLEPLFGFP